METDLLIKWLMGQCWLTGSSSGGAFPERVLEGNFSHALAHFLSFFCEQKKKMHDGPEPTSCYIKEVWGMRKDTSEEFTQVRFPLVQGSLSIFITDAHLGPISHKILRKRTK